MPNEEMKAVALLARKGGSGKSTLVKALASAALASGKTAMLIDTDPQGDLTSWFEDLHQRGMVPPGARLGSVASIDDLEANIHEAYERGDTDYIFIDTAGAGATWSDEIAVMVDHLVTPTVCSKSDLKIAAQTVEWFKRLHDRVERPDRLPPHHVVVTRFPADARASKLHMRLLKDAMTQFPIIDTIVQERSAYLDMDDQGFLGVLAQSCKSHPDPLQRGHVRRFEAAIVESCEVLNDIVGR